MVLQGSVPDTQLATYYYLDKVRKASRALELSDGDVDRLRCVQVAVLDAKQHRSGFGSHQ
jgi:hypothetical protein